MTVDRADLHTALLRACRDAGVDAGACVVWIVDAARPPGATPTAYLQPAARVEHDTVQVFRAVGPERVEAFEGSSHRLALWRRLPGLPAAALAPMLRHELAHAARWERSGPAFYAADERLRAVADAGAYPCLPTEREANAAAAAYARNVLSGEELAELGRVPELADLLAATPPADVVGETLALLGEEVEVAPGRLTPHARGTVVEVVAPA